MSPPVVILSMWTLIAFMLGDMLIDCAADTSIESFDDNPHLAIIITTLACLIALPWLIFRAATDSLRRYFHD